MSRFLRSHLGRGVALWLFAVSLANWGRAADNWLCLRTSDFTLITSLRRAEAEVWAAEFSQFVAAMRGQFTAARGELAPLTIVIFDRAKDFEKYRPLSDDGKPQIVAGFFSRQESWAVAGLGAGGVTEELRHTIFHEGVHWFLSGQETPNPLWLEEGLAEAFSTFSLTGTGVDWGKPIASHVLSLNRNRLVPLEKLLFTAQRELYGRDRDRTSMFYAESWALVHFLLFGQHDIPPGALDDFARQLQSGRDAEQAFSGAFGRPYKVVELQLQQYLRTGRYFPQHLPRFPSPARQVAPATAVEVQNALARLALASRRWSLALEHATAAVRAAPEDPRGHEVLALARKWSGDATGALAAFSAAKERKSRDFAPYFELACATQRAAENPAGAGRLSPQQAREVADDYEQAIELHPRFQGAYENLATVLATAEPCTERDREALRRGLKVFPRSVMIKVGIAVAGYRLGERESALAELKRLSADGENDGANARVYARHLANGWSLQLLVEQLKDLSASGKFDEGIAMIDRLLEEDTAEPLRARLPLLRKQFLADRMGRAIQTAFSGRRWDEARVLLADCIAGDFPEALKAQARKSLAELDRNGIGRSQR